MFISAVLLQFGPRISEQHLVHDSLDAEEHQSENVVRRRKHQYTGFEDRYIQFCFGKPKLSNRLETTSHEPFPIRQSQLRRN